MKKIRPLLGINKCIAFLVVFSFLVLTLGANPMSMTVEAKNKDVTAQLKGKSGIKSICKYVNMFVQTTAERKLAPKKAKVKLTESKKAEVVSLAITGLGNYKDLYSDNYENMYNAIKTESFRKQFKKLYGRYPDLASISISNDVVKTNNGKIYVAIGEWSEEASPAYKIAKLTKTGKKIYTITIKNQRKNYDTNSSYTIGTTKIKIEKNKKSSNGYVIKGISYRITGALYR